MSRIVQILISLLEALISLLQKALGTLKPSALTQTPKQTQISLVDGLDKAQLRGWYGELGALQSRTITHLVRNEIQPAKLWEMHKKGTLDTLESLRGVGPKTIEDIKNLLKTY